MRRACVLLGLLALLLGACGKYGPPVRSRPPVPPAAATAEPIPPDATEPDESEQEPAP